MLTITRYYHVLHAICVIASYHPNMCYGSKVQRGRRSQAARLTLACSTADSRGLHGYATMMHYARL